MVNFSDMAKIAKKKNDEADEREAQDHVFRTKIAMQQFMNHNGPIFRAFAFKGVDIREVVDGDILVKPVSDAKLLTRLVAAQVLGKAPEDVSPRESAFVRSEASAYVAAKWIKSEPLDIQTAATQIATVVKAADRDFDHDPYKDDTITNEVSLLMSAAGVTTSLMRQVDVYDFRMGKKEALTKVLDVVIGSAVEVANSMLPPGSSHGDVANLTQTVARNFSMIMEAIYERKARQVTLKLRSRKVPKATKVAWLDRNRPMDEIVADFKQWSECFKEFAIATSTQLSPTVEPRF
jgi:hypothetical protein